MVGAKTDPENGKKKKTPGRKLGSTRKYAGASSPGQFLE